jgi:nucleolar MIF4G domain-containing protein 1
MKRFVLDVSSRVADVTRSSTANATAAGSGGGTGLSTRARLMLELVIDIKNNRPAKAAGGGRPGAGAVRADGKAAGASASLSSNVLGWLKTCNVDRVAVRGISWDKLLLPNKKGGRLFMLYDSCRCVHTSRNSTTHARVLAAEQRC